MRLHPLIISRSVAQMPQTEVRIRTIRVHDEDLVALIGRAGGLENESLAVGGPVGFGVLAAVRELADIGEKTGLGGGERCSGQCERKGLHHEVVEAV